MTNENKEANVFETLSKSLTPDYTHIYPLAAIWLDKSVVTKEGKMRRIVEGISLKIENGEIVDLPEGEKPTHIITSTKGNLNSTILLLGVMDLTTQELSEIKL